MARINPAEIDFQDEVPAALLAHDAAIAASNSRKDRQEPGFSNKVASKDRSSIQNNNIASRANEGLHRILDEFDVPPSELPKMLSSEELILGKTPEETVSTKLYNEAMQELERRSLQTIKEDLSGGPLLAALEHADDALNDPRLEKYVAWVLASTRAGRTLKKTELEQQYSEIMTQRVKQLDESALERQRERYIREAKASGAAPEDINPERDVPEVQSLVPDTPRSVEDTSVELLLPQSSHTEHLVAWVQVLRNTSPDNRSDKVVDTLLELLN